MMLWVLSVGLVTSSAHAGAADSYKEAAKTYQAEQISKSKLREENIVESYGHDWEYANDATDNIYFSYDVTDDPYLCRVPGTKGADDKIAYGKLDCIHSPGGEPVDLATLPHNKK